MGVGYLVAKIIVNTKSNHMCCGAIEIICNINDSLNIIQVIFNFNENNAFKYLTKMLASWNIMFKL